MAVSKGAVAVGRAMPSGRPGGHTKVPRVGGDLGDLCKIEHDIANGTLGGGSAVADSAQKVVQSDEAHEPAFGGASTGSWSKPLSRIVSIACAQLEFAVTVVTCFNRRERTVLPRNASFE